MQGCIATQLASHGRPRTGLVPVRCQNGRFRSQCCLNTALVAHILPSTDKLSTEYHGLDPGIVESDDGKGLLDCLI